MSKLSQLKGAHIRQIDKVAEDNTLIVDISGPEHGGKSHFAMAAAGEKGMFYQTLEPHASKTPLAKFKDRDIVVAEYDSEVPPEVNRAKGADVQAHFQAMSGKFRTDLLAALKLAPGAKIVWDKAVNLWEVIRYAHFGKLTQVPAHKYGQANIDFTDLVTLPRRYGSTIIMLNEEDDEWVTRRTDKGESREPSGKKIIKAFKGTGYLSDARLRCWKEPPIRNAQGNAEGSARFKVTVIECRANPDLIGETLDNPTWQELCVLMKPDVDPDFWLQ